MTATHITTQFDDVEETQYVRDSESLTGYASRGKTSSHTRNVYDLDADNLSMGELEDFEDEDLHPEEIEMLLLKLGIELSNINSETR